MSGCFDDTVGDAEAQDSTESESGNSGTSVSTTPSLKTYFTTISPTNLDCSDEDVCVWEYAMTINTTSTEAIEVMSYSSTIEGSYYEEYDGSTRTRTTTGYAYAVSTCNSGHSWNNSLQLADNLVNAFLPTDDFLINWSISELNTQVNPTTCLGDTDCWIQQVTAPTLVVTCWIQQSVCILPSTCTGGRSPPCPTRM